MAWDFETDDDFAKELAWIDEFVRDEIEPVDLIIRDPRDVRDSLRRWFQDDGYEVGTAEGANDAHVADHVDQFAINRRRL